MNYLNRELSWLEFNRRVLDEAADPSVPLLDRLMFLAITGSNLDEFFRVRVGGLQMLADRGVTKPDPAGMSPAEQLAAIAERVREFTANQYALLAELEGKLSDEGFTRLAADELDDRQAAALEEVFGQDLFGVLTPIAVGPFPERPRDGDPGSWDGDGFPLVEDGTLNVLVRLGGEEPDDDDAEATAVGERPDRFAVLPCGRFAPRFLHLPADGGYAYTTVEEAVRSFADRFFPGGEVREAVAFRVTRNADLAVREDMAADLLREMEDVLDARREGDCARLELEASASDASRTFLMSALHLTDREVYPVPGPPDVGSLMRLVGVSGFDRLRAEPWPPQHPPQVDPSRPVFDTVAAGDVLLYHPYESYEPVVRLVEEAADDPEVLAIKQTLYRTSRDSRVVAALKRAAESGKSVAAVVELKARFDEARNIEWARDLEKAGVQVVHGVRGLKTHAKLLLVVRREPHGVQRYAHFGTGNYNESTARLYSDASLLTADDALTADAVGLFNAITGLSQPREMARLEAAPIGLRERVLELIAAETERARQGLESAIDAKVNSLVDPAVIDALYDASRAGVPIRLNVRGICCLRPGVPGLSESIRVVSIVDRFLEHARVMRFHHGGDETVLISSADWMPRNLDRRVELLVPVADPALRDRLRRILSLYFADTAKARELHADGTWHDVEPADGADPVRSQQVLWERAAAAVREEDRARRTKFDPHRGEG